MTTLASRSGSSTLRRLLTMAVVPVLAVSTLSACGANFNAQTNRIYQAAEGTNDRSAGVYSLNTLVVGDGDGNGTVVARLVNQQADADELQSYTAATDQGEEITTVALQAPVPIAAGPSPDQSVQLGTEGLLRLSGDNFEPGDFVTISFSFASSAPISLEVPVVAVGTEYGDIPVGPVASESTDPADG